MHVCMFASMRTAFMYIHVYIYICIYKFVYICGSDTFLPSRPQANPFLLQDSHANEVSKVYLYEVSKVYLYEVSKVYLYEVSKVYLYEVSKVYLYVVMIEYLRGKPCEYFHVFCFGFIRYTNAVVNERMYICTGICMFLHAFIDMHELVCAHWKAQQAY
jgi:hypothetical protein